MQGVDRHKEKISLSDIVTIYSARFLAGMVFALLSLGVCCFILEKWKPGLVFAALFIVSGLIRIKEGVFSERRIRILYFVWLLTAAFATGFISQMIVCQSFFSLGLLRILLIIGECK